MVDLLSFRTNRHGGHFRERRWKMHGAHQYMKFSRESTCMNNNRMCVLGGIWMHGHMHAWEDMLVHDVLHACMHGN